RSLGVPPLKLGRDAYGSGANYYIWHGQYYIQIIAIDTTYELRQVSMDLAEKLTDSLQDSGQPVWGLQALPQKNQVPQSVQYFLIDALGYSFLRNTYTAKYYKDKIEVSVFLSQQDSPESVNTIIAKLKGSWVKLADYSISICATSVIIPCYVHSDNIVMDINIPDNRLAFRNNYSKQYQTHYKY
ncbi:unnamed protein product, partial [marine sediment metagenome]